MESDLFAARNRVQDGKVNGGRPRLADGVSAAGRASAYVQAAFGGGNLAVGGRVTRTGVANKDFADNFAKTVNAG